MQASKRNTFALLEHGTESEPSTFADMQGLPIEVVNKGAVKNISIQMEDRMGGRKHVTKLSHVESFALEPNELAAELQRKFQVAPALLLICC